jgi:hypothetical protein
VCLTVRDRDGQSQHLESIGRKEKFKGERRRSPTGLGMKMMAAIP